MGAMVSGLMQVDRAQQKTIRNIVEIEKILTYTNRRLHAISIRCTRLIGIIFMDNLDLVHFYFCKRTWQGGM
jgi:hypothetical protein